MQKSNVFYQTAISDRKEKFNPLKDDEVIAEKHTNGFVNPFDLVVNGNTDAKQVIFAAAQAGYFSFCEKVYEKDKATLKIVAQGYAQSGYIKEAFALLSIDRGLVPYIGYGIGLSGGINLTDDLLKDTNLINWILYGASSKKHFTLMEKLLQLNASVIYCKRGITNTYLKITQSKLTEILAQFDCPQNRSLLLKNFSEFTPRAHKILRQSATINSIKKKFSLDYTSAYKLYVARRIWLWFLECNQLIDKLSHDLFFLIAGYLLETNADQAKLIYYKFTPMIYKDLLLKRLNSYSKAIFSYHRARAMSFLKAADELETVHGLKTSLSFQKDLLEKKPTASGIFFAEEKKSSIKHLSPIKNKTKDAYYDIIDQSLRRFSRI